VPLVGEDPLLGDLKPIAHRVVAQGGESWEPIVSSFACRALETRA
jgi:hypothetical protein